MTPPDYEYLRKLLKDHSGLDLSADKQYLIESRLLPLSRKCGVPGIGELVQKMKGGSSTIIAQVVEAMTTNETFFFRDKVPFEHFRDTIMPEDVEGARQPQEHPDLVRRRLDRPGAVFACDVAEGNGRGACRMARRNHRDRPVARKCSRNRSRASTASSRSSAAFRSSCSSNISSRTASSGRSARSIRAMVQHRQLNLLHDFSQLGTFDVIFCRNVLIYFDQDTKINIFGRLAKAMEARWLPGAGRGGNRRRPDGCLQAVPGQARALSAERRACAASALGAVVDAKNRGDGGTVSDDRGRQRHGAGHVQPGL